MIGRVLIAALFLANTSAALGAPLAFKPIKTVDDLQRDIANATTARRPVLLLVRAEWSLSGLELERTTLADPAVQAALKDLALLRADITNFDIEDKRLLAHLDLIGAPAVLLYGADGKEQRNFRGIGFMKAAKFVAVVRLVVDQTAPKAK